MLSPRRPLQAKVKELLRQLQHDTKNEGQGSVSLLPFPVPPEPVALYATHHVGVIGPLDALHRVALLGVVRALEALSVVGALDLTARGVGGSMRLGDRRRGGGARGAGDEELERFDEVRESGVERKCQ